MGRPSDVVSADHFASSTKRVRHWRSLPVGAWLLRSATLFTYAFLYLPIVVIIVMSFHPDTVLTFPMPGWSLRWYGEFLHDKLIIRALLNSFFLGGVTALLCAVIGTPCALGLVRSEFPGKRFISSFVLAPMIIPNVITAVGLLMLLNAVRIPRGFPYLIIGHVIFGLPYIVLTVSAQLYGFPRQLEEAALSLGAKELQTFFEITLPLIAPSIFAGMLFAFTISFQEYVASQFWASPSTYTLPIRIYSRLRDATTPVLNVVGVATLALSFGMVIILKVLSRRSEGGGFYGL
ncbi:MAG: ABC transporter permease [Ardenticatenaceae bacterium]|nr:ABC transporter permease [Ardenticatenaceae bacterium]